MCRRLFNRLDGYQSGSLSRREFRRFLVAASCPLKDADETCLLMRCNVIIRPDSYRDRDYVRMDFEAFARLVNGRALHARDVVWYCSYQELARLDSIIATQDHQILETLNDPNGPFGSTNY